MSSNSGPITLCRAAIPILGFGSHFFGKIGRQELISMTVVRLAKSSQATTISPGAPDRVYTELHFRTGNVYNR
jgi:hypothetical protein